jgi:predicted nucleic-acid-binding Zn-ribbon protein
MVEYQKKISTGTKVTFLAGRKCDRCGYTQLDNDDDVWTAAGL